MAYQGGTWTLPDGILPGARINFVAKERVMDVLSPRGILAVAMELDWGAGEEIQIFNSKDYTRDALYKFGYDEDSDELRNIGEMFKGATQVVMARLNGNGEKAKNEIAEAKWPGIRGNDIQISIEADPDAGMKDNPIYGMKVEFSCDGEELTATFKKVPEEYEPTGKVLFKDEEIDVPISTDGNTVTATLNPEMENGEYKLVACLKRYEVVNPIATGTYTIENHEETHAVVKVTLGNKTDVDVQTLPEDLRGLRITFKQTDGKVKATYSGLPEGYTMNPILMLGDAVCALIPGRIDEVTTSNTYSYVFSKDAPTKGTYKINARVKDSKGTRTLISSQEFTLAVEGEDVPAYVASEYGDLVNEEIDQQIPARFFVKTFLDGREVEEQKVRSVEWLDDSDFVIWNKARNLEVIAGEPLIGGTNGEVTMRSWSDALNRLEPQYFHVLAVPCDNETVKEMCINFTRTMRDDMGVYFQTVMPTTMQAPNYEAIIQVENEVLDKGVDPRTSLIYWVGGQEAGCKVQNSVANLEYDGKYTIDLDYSQRSLEQMVLKGRFFFHMARGIDHEQHCKTNVDINTLTEITKGKDESWTRNQTIRVMDQIGNDIAAIFNNLYFGKVPNTLSGRESLKNEIISYLGQLADIGAIDDFDPESVIVEPGQKKTVVIAQIAVTPVNAMEQMYMTVIVA